MTAAASVSRVLDLPARRAWDLVADPRHHTRWIPLTRITVVGLPLAVGSLVRAVSGPLARRGVPGFPDTMRVDVLRAPGRGRPGEAVFTKVGPLLLGSARIHVAPLQGGRSRVTWTEDVHLAGPLPRAVTAALLTPVLDAMLRYALHRVARDVRAGAP
jgi:hypothetical protein